MIVKCELCQSCLSQKRQTKWQLIADVYTGFFLRPNKNNASTLFHYFVLSTPPALPSLAFPSHQWDCCSLGKLDWKTYLLHAVQLFVSLGLLQQWMVHFRAFIFPQNKASSISSIYAEAQRIISFPIVSFDKCIECTSTLQSVPCVWLLLSQAIPAVYSQPRLDSPG